MVLWILFTIIRCGKAQQLHDVGLQCTAESDEGPRTPLRVILRVMKDVVQQI
jgi:hypothetical protein